VKSTRESNSSYKNKSDSSSNDEAKSTKTTAARAMDPDKKVESEEEDEVSFPALASGKMSMPELWSRLTIISGYFTPDPSSYWD
jgi:hypothetical protein